jgi:hypothetical protein
MYMNTREIEVLLGKYYEGGTSLGEEKVLRDFFTGPDVPEHLKSHRPLFAFFSDEQHLEMDDAGFMEKQGAEIAVAPAMSKVIPLRRNRTRYLFLTGIAASVLLLAGLFFTFQQDVLRSGKRGSKVYSNQLAYAEASEALMIVSANLNTGLKQVSRLQAVDKAMKNVQLFNRFYQYQSIIINPDVTQNPSKK